MVLDKGHLKKLELRAFPAIYLGNDAQCSDYYKMWNPETKRLFVSRNVKFFEGLDLQPLKYQTNTGGNSTLLLPSGTYVIRDTLTNLF